jgi:uncharacterized membrane protein YgcG
MLRWLTALLGWLAVAIAPAAEGLAPIPPLTARVTDLTGTLDATQRAQLENRLAALEREKGAQLVIVLVPSVQPESIEAYGIRLAEAWRIGRQGVDDGVIILVAKNDRAVRIEVGYGLESAIPDALAKRIIEERIVPRFREGDFYGGLSAGVDALARLIRGETLLPPAKRTAPEPQRIEWLRCCFSSFSRAPSCVACWGCSAPCLPLRWPVISPGGWSAHGSRPSSRHSLPSYSLMPDREAPAAGMPAADSRAAEAIPAADSRAAEAVLAAAAHPGGGECDSGVCSSIS